MKTAFVSHICVSHCVRSAGRFLDRFSKDLDDVSEDTLQMSDAGAGATGRLATTDGGGQKGGSSPEEKAVKTQSHISLGLKTAVVISTTEWLLRHSKACRRR
jgi:hypothetical protein